MRPVIQWLAVGSLMTLLLIGFQMYWGQQQQGLTKVSSEARYNTQASDPIGKMFQRRQERYMGMCSEKNTGETHGVFLHELSGLAVCAAPKVGCTFWRRIMTYLHTENRWRNPFEIDRYSVHHNPTAKFYYQYNSNYIKERIWNSTRVVFGRDPFSRLWSAYVDKIILPDSWKDFGLDIYGYRKLGNVKCPLNITFEDFLHYALYKKSNAHWNPQHTICSPCDFYPKYVGKMETFSRDVTYILNKVGLGYLLSNRDHGRHVQDEMSMMIAYFFKIHASREINKMCLTVTDLAERLWRAFQLNGYISLSEQYPAVSLNKSVRGVSLTKAKNIVTEIFIQIYKHSQKQNIDLTLQRHSVLVNAYKEIPLRIREDISHIYKHDFELFEYEKYPKYIFPEKNQKA